MRAAEDDLPGDGVKGLRRRGDERAGGDVALGQPRAFVKEPRRLVERLDVDLDDRRAERGEARERRLVGRSRCGVAEEQALAKLGRAEPRALGHRAHRPERARARIGVGGIGAGHRGKRREGIVDGERAYRHAIERAARRHHARGRDQAEARLEADDVLQSGRHPAGAGGIGAERQRHEPGRDRDRGARARAARDQRRIERVARNAVGRAHAYQPGRELIEVGLADDDGAGALEAGDAGRVPRRLIGEGRAAGRGRQALDVDIVLDRDRHAVEREIGVAFRGERLRARARVGLLAQHDEDGGIAVGADARVAVGDGRLRARFAGTMRRHDRGCRQAHRPSPKAFVTLSLPLFRGNLASRMPSMSRPLRQVRELSTSMSLHTIVAS